MVENPVVPLIKAEGITKRYGSVAALNDVSVTVTDRAVGLLGANGAGKSTLMRIMLGLIKPDAGKVLVMGVDSEAQYWDARRRLGYMPEHDCLPMGMTAAIWSSTWPSCADCRAGWRCCAPPRCCSTSAWRRSARA